MRIKKLNRTALLLALMIVFQSLRAYLPIPSFVSVYIIGSMVNACLLLAVSTVSWNSAFVLAVTAPVVAYLQQALPLPILILPVAAANLAYVTGFLVLAGHNKVLAIGMATATKFIMVYFTVTGLMQYLGISGNVAAMLTMMLGWPQWITGFCGGAIFFAVHKRLCDSITR